MPAGAASKADTPEGLGARPVTPVRVVGVTPGAAMLVVGAVALAFVLRNAFVAAHQTVGWVVACSIVALLIDPVVNILQRVIPRWLSILVVVLGAVGVFVGVFVGLARELLDSLEVLEDAAPRAARRMEQRYDWAADVDVSARVQAFFDDMHESLRESALQRALGTVPTYLVTGILMLFLLGYGRRYFLGFLKQFDDLDRRRTVRQVATTAAVRGREYLLLTLAYAAVSGVVFGLVCWMLDLPAPLVIGFAVAATAVIPLIGVLLGGIPALLLAFGSQAWHVGASTLLVARRAAVDRGAGRAAVCRSAVVAGRPRNPDHRRPARLRRLRHRRRRLRRRARGARGRRARRLRRSPGRRRR